ncbi:MAG: hypothetical protein M3Y44_12680 [Actinomycetota bacterium]|nr:hypothetical protein [Actinomycetota bacterium]
MTTPSNSPEPGPPAEPAEPIGPAEPAPVDATTAPGPAVPPPWPPGPPEPPGPPPGYYPWQPAAYPFAPVARAPRTPWVNPARRGHVAAAALVGALIFGGGGLLIGHAASDHGDRSERHGIIRQDPGQGIKDPGFGRGQRPRRPGLPGPPGPNVPATPAPTSVPSGSPTR